MSDKPRSLGNILASVALWHMKVEEAEDLINKIISQQSAGLVEALEKIEKREPDIEQMGHGAWFELRDYIKRVSREALAAYYATHPKNPTKEGV